MNVTYNHNVQLQVACICYFVIFMFCQEPFLYICSVGSLPAQSGSSLTRCRKLALNRDFLYLRCRQVYGELHLCACLLVHSCISTPVSTPACSYVFENICMSMWGCLYVCQTFGHLSVCPYFHSLHCLIESTSHFSSDH